MYFRDRHKTITCCYESLMRTICNKYELTQMECDILMFLHGNPECNTAASLVRICKNTKPNLSPSQKRRKQRGLEERQKSETKKKHIELHLTADAQPILADGIAIQKEFAKHALAGISQEEIAVFKSVFDQICNNAEAYLQQNK
ncbi:MAG: MarR family transcriptional regulator [Clostridia bacterium]|nr:MarR family transcriptional regulator [Clostridia bacterium]